MSQQSKQQHLDCGVSDILNPDDLVDRDRFVRCIKEYYLRGKRPMPWRDEITPYHVVVSEIMLQQTQVPRVIERFPAFISRFPDFQTLRDASLADVLAAWQGLGYNRRAKYLHAIAGMVMDRWEGLLPEDPDLLITLPGIGAATAGSIAAFAFNAPVVFIETNIRRVFIHHYFPPGVSVTDASILPIVRQTLDQENPREWYYALMDYGTWLAGRVENPNRRSRHYTRQSAFEGSDRQIRGIILKRLIADTQLPLSDIIAIPGYEPTRVARILSALITEGMVCEEAGMIRIT